jgi:predicted nucleic acid-binding protein
LLDTSVLVAAMVEAHPMHELALPWLQRVKGASDLGVVAVHSIAELYAILTTLPVHPQISPSIARRLIERNVLDSCEIVSLSQDYIAIIDHLSESGTVGGVTYDALTLHTALKANADRVITLNEKDLQRICTELADQVVTS